MITSPPIPGEVGVRWRTARVGGADDARARQRYTNRHVGRSFATNVVRAGWGRCRDALTSLPAFGPCAGAPNRAPAELPVRTRGRTSSRFGSADSRCELTLEVRSGRYCGIVWTTVRGSLDPGPAGTDGAGLSATGRTVRGPRLRGQKPVPDLPVPRLLRSTAALEPRLAKTLSLPRRRHSPHSGMAGVGVRVGYVFGREV